MNEELNAKIDALSATLSEILEAVKPIQVDDEPTIAETEDDETKYNQTDFLKAVTNLISETKQERNV